MKRLAIISSYNESCGNASYTHVLRTAFEEHVEVKVFALDQFLLNRTAKAFRKTADDHIKAICEEIKTFDYVNIQFEAGLYGGSLSDIKRRITWLIEAAPNLVFTMHRLDPRTRGPFAIFFEAIQRRSFDYYFGEIHNLRYAGLYKNIVKLCASRSKGKNVWICVHTKRERRIVQELYGFANCFDYPLAFLKAEERAAVLANTDSTSFKEQHGFPADKKIIGVFGYISAYKGIETVLSAMKHLPNDYILALFGSQHPHSIAKNLDIDPYLGQLLEQVEEQSEEWVEKWTAWFRGLRGRGGEQLPYITEAANRYWTAVNPDDALERRIRFIGNLDDPQFIDALHHCDAVVLPYQEVGQSMSGVIALAFESGARMFCSNNLSFFETRKYYGDVYHTFDIGNELELAGKIISANTNFTKVRDQVYSKYNIRSAILLQLEKFGHISTSTASKGL